MVINNNLEEKVEEEKVSSTIITRSNGENDLKEKNRLLPLTQNTDL